LENIAADTTMTTRQKVDFKAILNVLVYGAVSKISDDSRNEIIDNPVPEDTGGSGILDVIFSIFKFFAIVILLIGAVILGFFVYYKLTNKNSEESFTDFIAEKTGSKTKTSPNQVE
jgi:hypothetical protein